MVSDHISGQIGFSLARVPRGKSLDHPDLQTCVGCLFEDEAPPELRAGQREALPAGWVL